MIALIKKKPHFLKFQNVRKRQSCESEWDGGSDVKELAGGQLRLLLAWDLHRHRQVSISSTFYVQIFRTNVVSAAFSSYVLALGRNSYKKIVRLTLMKLTAGETDSSPFVLTRWLSCYSFTLKFVISGCFKLFEVASLLWSIFWIYRWK